MKVAIIGVGEVGRSLASTLTGEGQEVVLVDRDPDLVESVANEFDAMALVGNGASPKFIEEHDLHAVDLFLAVTSSDEANLLGSVAAKQLGAKHTIARVNDNEYFGSRKAFAYDVLGIDYVIHPARTVATEIAHAIKIPGAVNVELFAGGRLAVAEIIVKSDSELAGKRLGDPRDSTAWIMAIERQGELMIAEDEDRIKVGDRLIVVTLARFLEKSTLLIAGETAGVGKTIIFGAGRIGRALAQALADEKIAVTILEKDKRKAEQVADELNLAQLRVLYEPRVTIDALRESGVSRAGAFVACTGDDKTNLLAATYAKNLGCDLTLSVVSRSDYVPLVDQLGIDMAFAPRLLTAQAISRFLHESYVGHIYMMLSGAEILEMRADFGAAIIGKQIAANGLEGKCCLGAIIRDGNVLFPLGNPRIEVGDQALIFALPGYAREVEKRFQGSPNK